MLPGPGADAPRPGSTFRGAGQGAGGAGCAKSVTLNPINERTVAVATLSADTGDVDVPEWRPDPPPFPDGATMVNAMSTDQNIVYFADPDKAPAKEEDPTTRRLLLQDLQDRFVQRVTERFAAMLDNTDDALFALADKAESNRVQSLYFDSMREVRLKRGKMEARFRAEVLDGFRTLRRQPAGTAPAGGEHEVADGSYEELALVEHDDLEESLAVDGMVGKARSRHAQALAQLRARLDHLLPGVRLDEGANPVDPRRLCEAFRRAGQALGIHGVRASRRAASAASQRPRR